MLSINQQRELRLKKEAEQELRRIVDTGKCPECGGKLLVSLAIIGWHQCEHLYEHGFGPKGHGCSFQIFTNYKWGAQYPCVKLRGAS